MRSGVLVWMAMLALCAPGAALAQLPPDLPRAGPQAGLDPEAVLTRIAVGSCNRQDNDQAFWSAVDEADPQLFLMIGDNVYGDIGWDGGADLATFRAAYASLAGEARFAALRARVPMLATWDDHDFGPNDSGGDFAFKEASERLFEHFWEPPADVRERPGIYHSVTAGPPGKRVQVIMLDTRFFRSPLARVSDLEAQGRLGRYRPDENPALSMLGEEQWRWLEQELAEPADLRVLVSSIQVLTEAHHFESWSNLPGQRERLLALLAARRESGLVMLSGDRHMSALYRAELATGEEVWEMTASSLNTPLPFPDPAAREPDPLRRSPMLSQANFGTLAIDWERREVVLGISDSDGDPLAAQTISF